ncbi:MAG: glycerate kinase [Ruminococcaceae bacterium]|nr:glycerate kinase [Oscillospiraceae bacterium]
MKIVIAPDSFKGSLSASEAADCIEKGIRRVLDCETVKIPMADGGEGTVEALAATLGGSLVTVTVKGPLFDDVEATYCIAGELAVIEMSAASGITLVSKDRLDPKATSTYGTGELILDAIGRGCKRIILGIGGSATNDGGAGMAAALGARFLDKNGTIVSPSGGELWRVETIDVSEMPVEIKKTEFLVACDVTNPLCGESGASYVFGPQKGADKETVKLLDENLSHFASKIYECLGVDVREISGGGAAGGLGAGLYAFCGASLRRGFDIISETVALSERIKGADLVITGEGRSDYQTAFGKLPSGVANAARSQGIPCVLISGAIKGDISALFDNGIVAAYATVTDGVPIDEAIKNAAKNLERAAETAMREWCK